MADTFGSIDLPVGDDPEGATPFGDPLLGHLGAFLQAVINVQCNAAWSVLRPRADAAHEQPTVRTVVLSQPTDGRFNAARLPALFVWRERDAIEDRGLDWIDDASVIRALWVFPPDSPDKAERRLAFANAIGKSVTAAISAGRHPAWQVEGDEEPTSLDIDASVDALVLERATSTLPTTLSGALLDGAIGSATLSPRLEPTITTALVEPGSDDPGIPDAGDDGPGDTAVYDTSAPIVATVVDAFGLTSTRSARLTLAMGGETVGWGEDVRRVVSVDVPPQLSTRGSFSLGLGAHEGRGTVLAQVGGLLAAPRVREWAPVPIEIGILDSEGRIERRERFKAISIAIEARELFEGDPALTPQGGTNTTSVTVTHQGLAVSSGLFPDAGT